MTRRILPGPTGAARAGNDLGLVAGVVSHGHVFVTGMTGSGPDGTMPGDPETQFRAAFAKIAAVLAQDGLDLGDIVEMTSYHIDMAVHFDRFDAVRRACLGPDAAHAWTAVEVAGLRRAGALVEIRVVAAQR